MGENMTDLNLGSLNLLQGCSTNWSIWPTAVELVSMDDHTIMHEPHKKYLLITLEGVKNIDLKFLFVVFF